MRTRSSIFFAVMLFVSGFAFAQRSATSCAKDHNCPECQPRECMVSVEQFVGPGDYVYEADPACAGDMDSKARNLVAALAESQLPGISTYAGPLIDAATGEALHWIKSNIQGSAGEFLSQYTNPRANCQIVGLVIPKRAQVTGYKVFARDNYKDEKCAIGNDCAGGWCKWTHDPETIETGSAKFVYSTFKNWSHDRERAAKLVIFFVPPDNWINSR